MDEYKNQNELIKAAIAQNTCAKRPLGGAWLDVIEKDIELLRRGLKLNEKSMFREG